MIFKKCHHCISKFEIKFKIFPTPKLVSQNRAKSLNMNGFYHLKDYYFGFALAAAVSVSNRAVFNGSEPTEQNVEENRENYHQ